MSIKYLAFTLATLLVLGGVALHTSNVFLTATSIDSNQEKIQQLFNGILTSNNLPTSTTIIDCVDSASAAKIAEFLPNFLKKASSMFTIISAVSSAESFSKTLNPAVLECLKENEELEALQDSFKLRSADKKTLSDSVKSYILKNPMKLTGVFENASKAWSKNNVTQVGVVFAQFGHTLFDQIKTKLQVSLDVNDANTDIIQQVYNGIFEENGLADPTTVVSCIDTESAAKIVNYLPSFFKQASSVLTIMNAFTSLQNFTLSLNPQIAVCLQGNIELISLAGAYNLIGADQQVLVDQVTAYAKKNLSKVTSAFSNANKQWSSKNYNAVGNGLALFVHTVLDSK